jgi:hypothetical protein
MNSFVSWLKSKSITSHSVAAVAVSLATLIMTDETVRNFVLSTFDHHPKIGSSILALAGIILKYSHSSSPAGTVATAQAIESAPNPPTPAAVEAAKPKGA